MQELISSIQSTLHLPLENSILVFSVLLIVILLSPILFRRLHVPSIIVLIVSGILIGPNGFGIIAQSQSIDLFSTIGLLYIMFIVGLDLDLNEFRIHRFKSVVYGLLTFAVPMLSGYFVTVHVLDMSVIAGLLMACVFATHTLISYPIVSRMGVVKDTAVAVTVGGTIITDTAALFLLSFVLSQNSGGLGWDFVVRIVVAAACLYLIVFKFFPTILKWFFKHLENEKGSHFILVLSIMFLSAYISEAAGFESIIGAFLAGLAINRLIPGSSALMNRIDFIGNAFFIPFFLINVGMMIDVFRVVTDGHVMFIALSLTGASFLGKWCAAFITQKVFSMSADQRRLIFGLSSSRAAATIAVLLVGVRVGIVDTVLLDAAVVVILLTCTVSSVVTEWSARNIALGSDLKSDGDETGNSSGTKLRSRGIENIVLPISLDTHFERLIDFALLIKNRKSSSPLIVGTVLPNNEDAEEQVRVTRDRLEKYVKEASASETALTVMTTLDFNMSSGIVRLTKEAMADIIVMGWPRRMGFVDKLLGANAGGIVEHTNKTVFMCRITRPMILHKRIVLLVPPHAHLESGFGLWFNKINKLSRELSLPILLLSDLETRGVIAEIISNRSRLYFSEYVHWNSLLRLKKIIYSNDLVIVASARPGSPSYQQLLEQLPIELEIRFNKMDRIIVYPQQDVLNKLQGVDSAPTISLRPVQKLGRNLSDIFKNDKQ